MMISPWRSVSTCQPHALRTSPTPSRSQVLRLVPGSVHSCAYRPTKRPSYCGEVAIQCSIGGRYRIADTDCGPLGLVLTSNQLLQPPESITTPASSAALLAF